MIGHPILPLLNLSKANLDERVKTHLRWEPLSCWLANLPVFGPFAFQLASCNAIRDSIPGSETFAIIRFKF